MVAFLFAHLFSVVVAAAAVPTDENANRYRSLETFARALHALETMYVDPEKVKEDTIIQNALKGIVDQLDPHTMLMPKRMFEQLSMDTQGKFGGVGIIVSQERGKLIIIAPMEDTPASRAGIKSGDEIVEIDGKNIEKSKNIEAIDRMRGDPGSKIKLAIRRKETPELLKFELVREIVKVKSVRSQDLGKDIVYARISNFQEETTRELEDVIKSKKNIAGMILDLRDNPGGLLDQAVGVSDLFIENGVIVSTIGRNRDKIEREYAHKRGTHSNFPMITLVNGGSASASEIVAGALQDDERSLIMGKTTFGKGSVQTIVTLPDGSGLKLTIARYYTRKGRSIQAKGIKPDLDVADKAEDALPVQTVATKREADLKGHIESGDITDSGAKDNPTLAHEEWPENLQKDYMLITAFKYMRRLKTTGSH